MICIYSIVRSEGSLYDLIVLMTNDELYVSPTEAFKMIFNGVWAHNSGLHLK